MSEEMDTGPGDERDRDWLCEVLDEPERAVALAGGDRGGEDGTVRDEYLALLGMLPRALEPVAVPPELERRVLTAAGVAPPPRRAPMGWLLPVAATVACVALALAAWQAVRLGELRGVVARQARELAVARQTAERLARMEGENAEQAAALALLTAAGAEFCALRPPEASPMPEANGALAMSPDGSYWYLRVVGLSPRAEAGEYRLWFLRDGEPVDWAVLPASGAGGEVEMMDDSMPEGFNAVLITLEPAGSERPSGPHLLFGNQRMQIL